MQRWALESRRSGVRVGLVPTMGYLHEGHLSLMRRARRLVGSSGRVVVSIYVNPPQFGPGEDLSRYPRDLDRDKALCRRAGVDVVFAPSDGEMYREAHSTYVTEDVLSRGWEGKVRPAHFRGVATVVAKLFNLVLPSVAVFGAKDYQQAQVVRRMVRDLDFPVRVVVAPTWRERDGLAMSSRNVYLSPSERERAVVLAQAIRKARRLVRSRRGGIPVGRMVREMRAMIEAKPGVRVDYAGFVDPETLEPVARVGKGVRVVLAVRVGKTRLIDNGSL
jgi:pantoate--beta-alanine ligase